MPKILIISDLHNKIDKANSILNYESHDKVIWLGDFFDDWNDTSEDARRTAIWLKENLNNPNHIHLFGNHDQSHSYPFNPYCKCSGFTHAKNYEIWQVLTREDFDKLKFYHIEEKIFFSHAGLTMNLINQEKLPRTLNKLASKLDKHIIAAKKMLEDKKDHWIYAAGESRGGNRSIGGLTWADFSIDHVPAPFFQIVGHTPLNKPDFCLRRPKTFICSSWQINYVIGNEVKEKDINLNDYWWSLDLDTHLNHYAVLKDGVLIIKEIYWSGLGNKNINHTIEILNQKIF